MPLSQHVPEERFVHFSLLYFGLDSESSWEATVSDTKGEWFICSKIQTSALCLLPNALISELFCGSVVRCKARANQSQVLEPADQQRECSVPCTHRDNQELLRAVSEKHPSSFYTSHVFLQRCRYILFIIHERQRHKGNHPFLTQKPNSKRNSCFFFGSS